MTKEQIKSWELFLSLWLQFLISQVLNFWEWIPNSRPQYIVFPRMSCRGLHTSLPKHAAN